MHKMQRKVLNIKADYINYDMKQYRQQQAGLD